MGAKPTEASSNVVSQHHESISNSATLVKDMEQMFTKAQKIHQDMRSGKKRGLGC